MNPESLCIALCQMTPVWLNKKDTTDKIITYLEEAASKAAELAVFGEALLPGYPFWVELTEGAKFNSEVQKELYAHYVREAVSIEEGDLNSICEAAKRLKLAVYLGTIERGKNRGNHSVYCSLVYIDQQGEIQSVHRKLMPTYEERLVWAQGDGKGLVVHPLKDFTVGGLNCWENWLPMPRASLYAQGENVHIAVWPGNVRNTVDITRFIAMESRSYVISVSGLMGKAHIPDDIPQADLIKKHAPEWMGNGGSCLAAPDGSWMIEPIPEKEGVFTGVIHMENVLRERQNLDVSGHYSRPDVLQLQVNRGRQQVAHFSDEVED
ncbi:MAG: carbon-nitrogen hydrolase family protein [Bacteroidota bacterium]